MIKKITYSILALFAIGSIALAQTWPNYPKIGAPSYCQSTVNGVCVSTILAGPAITGNETVPLDTNISGGASPQTVVASLPALGLGATVISTNATGETVTVASTTRQLILTPAGTLNALTINLPAASASMVSNQRIGICGTQIITTLTMGAGTGNTFSTTAPTAMLVPVVTGAASCFAFIYEKTSATVGIWHRIQ